MSLQEWMEELKGEVQIPFTKRDLERALLALLRTDNLWDALRLSNVPMKLLCHFWNRLIQKGMLKIEEGKLRLTEQGKKLCEELSLSKIPSFSCKLCQDRGLDWGDLSNLAHKFLEWTKGRPSALQKYDQGYVDLSSVWSRTAFLWKQGDLAGKEIFVLGDDDLSSLSFAMTKVVKKVVVIDIDERLIHFLRQIAEREKLPLEAEVHDLREPLPEKWIGAFDTFFCDPTESLPGFKAFVERGLLSLKGEGCAGYFGLTRLESSLSKWAKVQKFLLEKGAVITHILEYFNEYENWEYLQKMRSWDWLPVKEAPSRGQLWYTSSLFRIEVVEKKEIENRKLEGNIFDDLEVATT